MTPQADISEQQPTWRRFWKTFWGQLLAAVGVTALVFSFIAKPYLVPSGSMKDTLQPGDRVLVNRLAYLGGDPEPGDVVVFEAGMGWDAGPAPHRPWWQQLWLWVGKTTGLGPSGPHTLVKRVIATSGQRVECCSPEGELLIDGVALAEPYLGTNLEFTPGVLDCTTTPSSSRCLPAVVVPEGSYLMLGDNRASSADSAAYCRVAEPTTDCWRWARRADVVGRVEAILWPPNRWGSP